MRPPRVGAAERRARPALTRYSPALSPTGQGSSGPTRASYAAERTPTTSVNGPQVRRPSTRLHGDVRGRGESFLTLVVGLPAGSRWRPPSQRERPRGTAPPCRPMDSEWLPRPTAPGRPRTRSPPSKSFQRRDIVAERTNAAPTMPRISTSPPIPCTQSLVVAKACPAHRGTDSSQRLRARAPAMAPVLASSNSPVPTSRWSLGGRARRRPNASAASPMEKAPSPTMTSQGRGAPAA